jgi:drug/metabolite transporter (DMT)-like permease
VFGTILTLPFAIHAGGIAVIKPAMPLFHALRAALLISATGFFFWGLRYLSIADTLSIFFVQPLVVTMLSPVVLGEHVGIRRWSAVVAGFIGTLIIIRPGLQAFNPGVVMALAAGTSLAFYMLMTRKISGAAPAMVTTYHTSLMGAAIATAIVVFTWQQPSAMQWLLFVGLAFVAALGHYLIVRAYDYGEASLLAPLAYTEMIMATALGWWFFGEFPDRWTFLGVAILIGCAIYISVRERVHNIPPPRDFEQP